VLDVEAAKRAVPDPWQRVEPRFSYVPEWDYTLGPEVADLCALLGFAPDPEQELILDCAFGMRDGLPAASTGEVIASRQTVKSSGLEMVVLGWAFLTKEPLVLWSAHELKTARETFLHLQELIEGRRWASRRVKRFYGGINDMGFVFHDGRRVSFSARTTEAGRGKSAPKMIRDEDLETRDEQMAASQSVTSTFPWAQVIGGSSGAKDYSEVLHRAVKRGREGAPGRYFHLEWADDGEGECARPECAHAKDAEGCRLDDPLRLRASNPTVGRIRVSGRGLTWEALADERRDLAPAKFGRERLTWHDVLRADLVAAKPFSHDELLVDADSRIVDAEPVFALDVAPGAAWSSVVVGGRNASGLLHVEIPSSAVEVPRGGREWARRPGDAWVRDWFASRLDAEDESSPTYERMRVLLLAGSEAESLAPALRKLPGLDLEVVPWASYSQACGVVTRLVKSHGLVFVGEGPLVDAALAVVRKPSTTDRATGWIRVDAGDDISPWVAATLLALHFEGVGEDGFNVW